MSSMLPDRTFRVTRDTAASHAHGLPLFGQLAIRFAAGLKRGRLDVVVPDGRTLVFEGAETGPQARMMVRDWNFGWRLIRGGQVGFAEAYLRHEWDTPDLTQFLLLWASNQELIQRMLPNNSLTRLMQLFGHWLNRNTRRGSQKNIHAHYDLGNGFYSRWLDGSMTYSSALFTPETPDLAAAQTMKYRALADAIGLHDGHHVLEIGCGWGGFAEYAAGERGARVTALTISREQYDYTAKRVFEAGLNERVTLKLQDYRDETGSFDRIASIEMIEAVGEKYWPIYFGQLRDRLKPGGAVGIQAITIPDEIFPAYRAEVDFIRKYVFPGGMLPPPGKLEELGRQNGLTLGFQRIFGQDYARTLAEWRERFEDAWPQLTPLGFDERFRRLWRYYLCYCEAGFRAGVIDVRHMVFARA